ncbi:MAG: preprotein translocase subunit SecE [Nitrospira sp.]|nr:preprotein translocase subunit SecE [Nitrospira sp.]
MFKKLGVSIKEFVIDVKTEVRKVSFPSKAETMGSTMVVIVFCVIMSLFLSVADSFLVWLISKVI